MNMHEKHGSRRETTKVTTSVYHHHGGVFSKMFSWHRNTKLLRRRSGEASRGGCCTLHGLTWQPLFWAKLGVMFDDSCSSRFGQAKMVFSSPSGLEVVLRKKLNKWPGRPLNSHVSRFWQCGMMGWLMLRKNQAICIHFAALISLSIAFFIYIYIYIYLFIYLFI